MINKIGLTEKENLVYQAIVEFMSENNYAPTVRELVSMTKINSTATVRGYIDRLKRKGYLTCKPSIARSIVIKQVTE